MGNINTIQLQKYAGAWKFGDVTVYIKNRPRWLTRKMCKLLLEWEWIDND